MVGYCELSSRILPITVAAKYYAAEQRSAQTPHDQTSRSGEHLSPSVPEPSPEPVSGDSHVSGSLHVLVSAGHCTLHGTSLLAANMISYPSTAGLVESGRTARYIVQHRIVLDVLLTQYPANMTVSGTVRYPANMTAWDPVKARYPTSMTR